MLIDLYNVTWGGGPDSMVAVLHGIPLDEVIGLAKCGTGEAEVKLLDQVDAWGELAGMLDRKSCDCLPAEPSTVGLGGQINKLLDTAQKARKKPKTCRECVSCLVPLPQASYDDGIRRDPRCCYNLEVNEVRAWVALDRPACFLGELRDEPLSEGEKLSDE